MNDKKSINKSIRLTPGIYNYIDSYPGNGFNEKFENIILEAMEFESDRKRRIQFLDDQIESKVLELEMIKDKIKSLNKFLLIAVRANSMIKELDELTKDIVSQNKAAACDPDLF